MDQTAIHINYRSSKMWEAVWEVIARDLLKQGHPPGHGIHRWLILCKEWGPTYKHGEGLQGREANT